MPSVLTRPARAGAPREALSTLSIVHILDPAPAGGLESVVHGLACGQLRVGHRVRVLAPRGAQGEAHPFLEPLRRAGVPFDLLELPPRGYLAERRRVAELLCEHRPHVVHTHGYRPDLLDASVARGLGIPVVTTVHGSSRMGGVTRLYEWMQWRAFRRFDGVVAVSRPLGASLEAAGVRRVSVIPNALAGGGERPGRAAARAALGVNEQGAPLIGFVGRLIPAKGADLFLEALAAVRDLPWRASVVGDGGDRPMLEALAARLGIADRVRFHGAVDSAGALFAAFDLFVLSSRTEGTPMVLLEAMDARVPVVAARVGGVPDVVGPREALLAPPLDVPALSAAVRAALGDCEAARARAEDAARRVAAEFGAERWLARYEDVYRGIQRTESLP
ncbi:MAG: glycosyltransferase [Gemmatimonadetes bacterium]|nr:glycosyltransferase [Gemmatimonadota bacterium]